MSENQKQTSESQLQLAAILATLKSIAVHTNQHWAPQWPASVEGVALVGKTDNTTKSSRTILGPAAADSSTPWTETRHSYDYESRKRAASHKDVVSIDRNNQYRDKRKRGPFTAASDTKQYPSRPPAGVSSFDSFVVNDHQSGGEFTPPIRSNQHIWESDDPARDGSNASWGGNLPHEQDLSSSTTPSQRPTPHFRAIPKRQASMRSPSDMHKNARRPIDHWSPPHAPRSYGSSPMAQGAYRDSSDSRPCQLEHAQRDKAGIQQPSRSRNPFPYHRTQRREDRHVTSDLHLDEHMDSRPYCHQPTELLLRSAPAPQDQGAEISSSRTEGASTSVSTKGRVAVGSTDKLADSPRHLAISSSHEAVDNSDFEELERLHSEISEDGQNLERALLENDTTSFGEAEVSEPKEMEIQDLPIGEYRDHPEVEGRGSISTSVASRELSEFPDIEQLLAENQHSLECSKDPVVLLTEESQISELQDTRGTKNMIHATAERSNVEAQAVSTLAQSETRQKIISMGVEDPQLSISPIAWQRMQLLNRSSRNGTDVSSTLQSANTACPIQGPTNRQATTHGSPSSNPDLPAASKGDAQAKCVPPSLVLSYPNTIEVQIPARTNTQRQFMRPIPSKAREIEIGSSRGLSRRCKCSRLPNYFRNPPSLIPSLKTWPAGKTEFLAHCQQIVDCPAHPDITRNNCRDILSNERRQRAVHGATPSQEVPTEVNEIGGSTSSNSDQRQSQGHGNTIISRVLDNGKISDIGRNRKRKPKETLATRTKSDDLTKSPSQRSSDERPRFRVPPGFPCSPMKESTGDTAITNKENQLKGLRSKSHKYAVIIQTHKTISSLPTPANSSSPSRAEGNNFHQVTNDDQASHSSQQLSSTPYHVSKQQPDLTDRAGHATLASSHANNGSLQNAESAGSPPKRPSGAVVHDNNPSTSSKVHKAWKNAHRNNSTTTKNHINTTKSPRRQAKSFHRRHATEPPHSPKLMTPVKALKNLSQNPTRKPLFPITNLNTLNQQKSTPPVVGQPTNPRPLWQRTPPPTPPNARRKSYIPADKRKQSKPVLSRHVPPRDRESDEKLIAYGRLKCTYDRHLAAPYAFRWCGKLYHEYRYLVALRDEG
ncbi:MAG: hypothetical protein Q9192_007433, partial [Flavoplaca navasiana]